ncbi:tetratricopeptide repeat protein [Polynucleobacter sp. JS-Mosq-20-D10]|nr:tetratricopeptide repeat protein [Polynucleobacter sp. JS-Mosq-20-D10]
MNQLEVMFGQAIQALQNGNPSYAETVLLGLLKQNPSFFPALQIVGMLKASAGNDKEAVNYLSKAAKINPNDPALQYNLGKALSSLGRHQDALVHHVKATKLAPGNGEAWLNYGISLTYLRRPNDALEAFRHSLSINPQCKLSFYNQGLAFKRLSQAEQAKDSFMQALKLDSQFYEACIELGVIYLEQKNTINALKIYETAVSIRPNSFEGWLNYTVCLILRHQFQEALISNMRALELRSDLYEGWANQGLILLRLGRLEDALEANEKALAMGSGRFDAIINKGIILSEMGRYADAIPFLEEGMLLKPDYADLLGLIVHAKSQIASWEGLENLFNELVSKIELGERVTLPFSLLSAVDSPDLQKKAAEVWVKDMFDVIATHGATPKLGGEKNKIRVGYFSSDFRSHPVGFVVKNIIQLHNSDDFEIYGFFLNEATDDEVGNELRLLFKQSFDLYSLSSLQAEALVRDQMLDIAVDLNSHTGLNRMQLFSKRIAPIQIGFLGYAGTSGANFYDYLVSDEVCIPSESQPFYSEKIAYLPGSCFPADSAISYGELDEPPSRQSQGLPNSGFIFACFNNVFKITPAIFRVWMRLLQQVPNSVLWFSKSSPQVIINLKNYATQMGVDSDRLIFSDRTEKRRDHLNRLQLADLFLDTPNYNAHTTAADALWAEVPVLTLIGKSFAARVAASQLSSLGMHELITSSESEYFDLALSLSKNPEQLKLIKEKLSTQRLSSKLFDTHVFTRNLESAYKDMYRVSKAGIPVTHLYPN